MLRCPISNVRCQADGFARNLGEFQASAFASREDLVVSYKDVMPIERLLEQCRNEYQVYLRKAVSAERLKHPNLVTELAMRINGDNWDERLLLVRIDMVWGDPDKPELMNAESHPVEVRVGEVALESVIGDMPVVLTKFRWDYCAVSLHPVPDSWLPIWQWFDSWFDPDGRHQPDDDGFEGVIHAISQPEFDADGNTDFIVDFGSAPSTCVTELIESCSRAGVREMILT